jgi:crossover junction endodeoxyribonuclease RuvC
MGSLRSFTSETPHLVLGVDPGLYGALAFYDPVKNQILELADFPLHEIKGKQHLDIFSTARIIEPYAPHIKMAVIEKVGAAPHQGTSSTFKFGYTTGIVTGIIAAHYIPFQQVPAAVWKMALGLTQDKDASRQRASRLFPKEANYFSRKKDDGRAEALLIAMFGARGVK